MSFLQPWMLFALPLVALPILIHLLNRQRHRPVPWGAMMFLVDAKKMSRGMARIRQWLILALRALAVAGLIFAASRPLSSGWLGVAVGGPPDTVLVLLDRSASMGEQDLQSGLSKRSTALRKIADLIETYGSGTRLVLIESTRNEPIEVESARSLLDLPQTGETSTAADIPALLQSAHDYITANETGRTDLWLCSDARSSDWDAQGGRWESLRESLSGREGLRLQLLTYSGIASDNVAVTVSGVMRRERNTEADLLLDIHLQRPEAGGPLSLPIEIIIDGARSVLPIEMTETEMALQGHSISIDPEVREGHGRVEIPADGNPVDNVFFFTFADPPERKTVIVSDDSSSARALRLAAGTSVDPLIPTSATVIRSDRIGELDWEETALIVWQAPLPEGRVARQLQDFAARGRSLFFFPPESPGDHELFGGRWDRWKDGTSEGAARIATWRWDADLLANSASGRSLPVGELETYRYCTLTGRGQDLARFETGDPLLRRAEHSGGAVYFCSTLPRASHSSLARDGIAFYAMLQRALAQGSEALARAKLITTAQSGEAAASWKTLELRQPDALPLERPHHAGVFESASELIAVNRPPSEDLETTLSESTIDGLFEGLDYQRVEDRIGGEASLASEVWRVFLVAMALCLVGEAWLSLPQRKRPAGSLTK